MTTSEAAVYLGCTRAWIWQRIKTGDIAAEKRGRDWHMTQDELDRYTREKKPQHRPRRNSHDHHRTAPAFTDRI